MEEMEKPTSSRTMRILLPPSAKAETTASPDMRRKKFRKAMPCGALKWSVDRTSSSAVCGKCLSLDTAVAGTDAMKKDLVESSEGLGDEFYLSAEADIKSRG